MPPLPGNQGISLLPLARGEDSAPKRGGALCEDHDSAHPYEPPVHVTMLRHDRHKLIVNHGPPATDRARTGELYDLERDQHELTNLWDDPGSRAIRHAPESRLVDVLVATEDRSRPRETYW